MKSATADVEFMDYVGSGQVIRLGAGDVLVLSYLKLLRARDHHGRHRDGRPRQQRRARRPGRPHQGAVRRRQDPALLRPGERQRGERVPGAERRDRSSPCSPAPRWCSCPRTSRPTDRTLTLRRTDRPGERRELKLDDAAAASGFYDLARQNVSLARGATYEAGIGGRKLTFHVDAKAKSGAAPVVSRLLRFQ